MKKISCFYVFNWISSFLVRHAPSIIKRACSILKVESYGDVVNMCALTGYGLRRYLVAFFNGYICGYVGWH